MLLDRFFEERSTVGDLLTFAEAVAEPMSTPLAESFNVALAKRSDVEPVGAWTEQGLGFIRFLVGDGSVIQFHNGGTSGFRSTMVVHAPTRTAVVALCNEAEVESGLDSAAFGLISALINGQGGMAS